MVGSAIAAGTDVGVENVGDAAETAGDVIECGRYNCWPRPPDASDSKGPICSR